MSEINDDVCICIPTLNEKSSIITVVNKFKSQGYDNIIIIDGGSTDDTKILAEQAGAKTFVQTWDGNKGSAMREAINFIDESIIVFVDGDGTYDPEDIDKLVKPIREDNIDHTLACRFSNMEPESMSSLNKFGNKIINITFSKLYNYDVKDVLTGYRAIKKESIKELNLESQGFCIETEMTAKSILNNHNIKIIPSSYYKRHGESKLNSFRDGLPILYAVFKYRF